MQNIFDSVNDRRNAEKVKFICYDRPNPTWDGSSAVVWHKGGWGVCCKFLMQLRIDLSVLSGVLSCLRCGPALLVRASVSEPVMRASARHGVWTIIQGGGGGGGGRLLVDSPLVCVRAKRGHNADANAEHCSNEAYSRSKYLLSPNPLLLKGLKNNRTFFNIGVLF